jgi:WD40 repeat protein
MLGAATLIIPFMLIAKVEAREVIPYASRFDSTGTDLQGLAPSDCGCSAPREGAGGAAPGRRLAPIKRGPMIGSASSDLTTRIWDLGTQSEVWSYKHTLSVSSCGFAPDGRLFVSASQDKTAKIWNVSDPDPNKWKEVSTLKGHPSSISDVAWNDESNMVVTCSGDIAAKTTETPGGLSKVWGPSEEPWDNPMGPWGNYGTLRGHQYEVKCCKFSRGRYYAEKAPYGSYIATGSADRTAKMFDISSEQTFMWRAVHTFDGHAGPVTDLAFSHDGFFLGDCELRQHGKDLERY